LHIHSRYTRGAAKDLEVSALALWARHKRIDVVGTGDFTHPGWMRELRARLKPGSDGFLHAGGTQFALTAEVRNVFPYEGKLRKVDHLLLSPSFDVCERIVAVLGRFGNLAADGRPILSVSAGRMVEYVMEISQDCAVIPVHAWTPWYALFAANSGFDALEACYADQTPHVRAVETGLGADPGMVGALPQVGNVALVSFSNAKALHEIGREATELDAESSYDGLTGALAAGRIARTYEAPARADRGHDEIRLRIADLGARGATEAPAGSRPPYVPLVPLESIVAEAIGQAPGTLRVRDEYLKLVQRFGGELNVLFETPLEELRRAANPRVLEGVALAREVRWTVEPGAAGEPGRVRVFGSPESDASAAQMPLFG
jgi:PHP family Zn ribbon phosphoesterase